MSKILEKAFGNGSMLLILASASMPLAPRFAGVNFYTPYVFIIPVAILVVASWALQNGRIRLSRAARAYAIVPVLMFLLLLFGEDRTEQLNAILPYFFGSLLFLTTLLLFKYNYISSNILLRFAYIFFLIETPIVIVQSMGWSEFGIISSYLGAGEERLVTFGESVRISGTFGNPNVFAQVYQLMSAIIVSDFLFSRRQPKVFLSLVVIALTGLVIVLTLSRSGLLFFILVNASLLIAFMKEPGRKASKTIILFMLAVIFLTLVVLVILQLDSFTISARFKNLESSGRLETYLGALSLLRELDVLLYGVGGDQFFEGAARHGIYFQWKSWIAPELMTTSVHNLTLKMLTEFGVVVSFFYAWAVVGFIRIGYRTVWPNRPREKLMFAMPLLFLFLIPFQLGTTGASIWLISIFSIYFAVIESERWGRRVMRSA